MKFNKMMTKVLSALIMVSMVGTSVQVPTLAEVTNAGRAIVAGTVMNSCLIISLREVKQSRLSTELLIEK